VIDLETTSTEDLRKTGTQAYAEHPETRITVLCYAIDAGPVRTWTRSECPDEFRRAIAQGATIVAHNYLFEWNFYRTKLIPAGWPEIPLSRWSCTMARALVAGYPAGLEAISRAAKLAIPKDAGARDLMLRMARPRTWDPITWWHETSPSHFQRLCDYCVTDVEAERLVDKLVPELSPRERLVFEADHAINQKGLNVDEALVRQLRDLAQDARTRLTADIVRATNRQVTSPNQVGRLRDWLVGVGVDAPDLRRATVTKLLLQNTITGPARSALQARLDMSRSSTAKLDAILAARSQDGRVKGCFQYYGAARTGRWAGRRLQPQNLYRGSIPNVNAALKTIMAGGTVDDLDLLFEDSPLGVIASCLRSTIIARPGHKLVVMDFGQIEARVLAWLANEIASLEVFADPTKDIYVETARRVGSSSRQLGKVLVLACGYGMGAERFQQTAAGYGLALSLWDCADLVQAWREANASIVDFWWHGARTLTRITPAPVGTRATVTRRGNVSFLRARNAVLARLPCGRHLVYRWPHVETNGRGYPEFTYMGSFGGAWVRQRSWPGKIAENITQAVARDVMAEAMITLHQMDIPLIATVHDELIAEVAEDEAEDVYTLMKTVMCTTPAWAPGLPLTADGFIAQRYQKK
jgi:DNA polymerase